MVLYYIIILLYYYLFGMISMFCHGLVLSPVLSSGVSSVPCPVLCPVLPVPLSCLLYPCSSQCWCSPLFTPQHFSLSHRPP